jgi:hypothetical protein
MMVKVRRTFAFGGRSLVFGMVIQEFLVLIVK